MLPLPTHLSSLGHPRSWPSSPSSPGLREAGRGRLKFRLLRSFGTPNPRPSRSRSPALRPSGPCSSPSGSRAVACAFGADQPAGLLSRRPSVPLPAPPPRSSSELVAQALTGRRQTWPRKRGRGTSELPAFSFHLLLSTSEQRIPATCI